MTPLCKEVKPIRSSTPPHLGPATPEVNSVWFKFFIYFLTGYGPPSLLLSKGTRLKILPKLFKKCSKVLVTTWGHDPTILPITNVVFTVNEALCHAAVLLQAYGETTLAETILVPFPISKKNDSELNWFEHPAVKKLSENIDLKHNCGFLTMVNLKNFENPSSFFMKETTDWFGKNNNVVNTWMDSQVAESDTLSPINGIANKEFVEILEKEIDDIGREEKKNENVSENLQFSTMSKVNENLMRWTLFDCDFGVPLFNAKTNQQVCDVICEHKLWTKSR